MSFASDVKTELCEKKPDRKCCSLAECYGILLCCNTFSPHEIRIITGSREFASRLPKLFKRAFGVTFDVLPDENKSGKCSLLIRNPDTLRKIFNAFGLEPEEVVSHHINYGVIEEECCRISFLRGAFLAGGSVTDPEKHYHMEFSTDHANVAREMIPILQELGVTPKAASRKTSSLLYFKQADTISDLLIQLGADVTAMNVITAKVEKGMRNQVTRQINCDSANADKVVSTAQEQIDAIHRYAKEYGLDSLPDTLKDAAILRITNPASSLSDLAKLSYPPVTKSCLAYRLKRIMEYIPKE